MAIKVGDKVQVLDTEGTYYIKAGDVGIVKELVGGTVWCVFGSAKVGQILLPYQLQPVDEVIRVDCHKPNIFKRVCMYLRGKI